jgi:hypothetical protein
MIALEAKRGVEATLERVFKATGNRFEKLVVAWTGTTAGIKTEGETTYIMFPSVDETKPVPQTMFNELIGYALHELGHKWFTQDGPWDNARKQHGAYVSALINGLEDPRIEECVVHSGYAPNARVLFEFLTNQVLRKNGYVEPDDFKNIPFMLAIEGRRLNGYTICFDSIVDASPYRVELRWALRAAKKAKDTKTIVKIAVELYARLKQRRDELKQQEQQQPQQPQQDQPGDKSQQGQDANSGGSEASQNGAGDTNADGEGEGEGEQGSQPGDQPGDEPGDEPSDQPGQGGGHGEGGDEPVGRNPEPTDFINDRCGEIKSDADERRPRPHVGKPIVVNFNLV